jgi:hypothetical protein
MAFSNKKKGPLALALFVRHSGARALRKIDYVNFVAKRASPESITPAGNMDSRACAKRRIPE